MKGLKSDNVKIEIVCAGIGGRGVLLASTILIECAISAGCHAMASDEYGMSQRGGSVISHVKVGRFKSPIIGRESADILISFEESEFYRNLIFLKDRGLAFINSAKKHLPGPVDNLLKRKGISVVIIDADGIAKNLGMIQASNMALLGCFAAFSIEPYNPEALKDTIKKRVAQRLIEKNLDIFQKGLIEGKSSAKKERGIR